MSLIGRGSGWGGRLFEAGRLLTFSAFRMGAYSRWALIRGWALIRINTVYMNLIFVTRMDSIDVYLEKKRKRVEMFNQSAKRAKVIRIIL